MGLLPRRAGVFVAHRNHVERGHQVACIPNAFAGIRAGGIASGDSGRRTIQRSRAAGRIELWQSVERLVRNSILLPVFPHGTEVVIERAIFLRKKDDVIDRTESCRSSLECRRHRSIGRQSQAAGSLTRARPGPSFKGTARLGRRRQHNRSSAGKAGGAGSRAVDPRRSAGHCSGAGACASHRKLDTGTRSHSDLRRGRGRASAAGGRRGVSGRGSRADRRRSARCPQGLIAAVGAGKCHLCRVGCGDGENRRVSLGN